jgi:quinol-cytochrome oxidoreductase complex cytochrome b subunit
MPRPNFYHHLHPPSIPEKQARWGYTLGLGGSAVFLFLVVGLTGILELFYYVPTPEGAALSIQQISYLVPLGGLIRNLHYWSAQLLLVVSGLHLLRVLFTAAYRFPRRFNYLLGMIMFLFLLLLNFSGYALRWDQGIQWALVTGTNLIKTIPGIGDGIYRLLLGGEQLGASALLRFYAWHVMGLVLPGVFFLVWHIFRVRRDGGIAAPPRKLREDLRKIRRTELVRREVLAMLYWGAGLLLLSALAPAPIAPPITEVNSLAGEVRAPWFFLWIQGLLRFGNPFWFGVVLPLLVLGFVSLIPYLFPAPVEEELGSWFPPSGRLAQLAGLIVVLLLIGLSILAW